MVMKNREIGKGNGKGKRGKVKRERGGERDTEKGYVENDK